MTRRAACCVEPSHCETAFDWNRPAPSSATVRISSIPAPKGEFKIHRPHQLTAPIVVRVPAKKSPNASGEEGDE